MSDSFYQEFQNSLRQKQFLEVIGRDEAEARFREHISFEPLGAEQVRRDDARGRVLACDIVSAIDVPGFDRSNVDGFALQAADTVGAMEEAPIALQLNREVLSPGIAPMVEVTAGTATPIATGGMVPRGADAVVMIEHTDVQQDAADGEGVVPQLLVYRSLPSGHMITFAGTDIAKGETVLREGQLLTSREIGVLAALGHTAVEVRKRPRVAVISTGNEIVAPGDPLPIGSVYDSNAAIISAAVEEQGCVAIKLGTVRDDLDQLERIVADAMNFDAIILSGGTSKGAGDLSYRVVEKLHDPGIVAHGVALKPGKPICLAVSNGKPIVVLPGFPTSAIFTFHEFVVPVLRELAGLRAVSTAERKATLPIRVNSDRGRTEYVLVSLCPAGKQKGERDCHTADAEQGARTPVLNAWPIGKGSGSVTTFSHADGFIRIGQQEEFLDAGQQVTVRLLGRDLMPADLVVIGSHCVGLDIMLGELRRRGFTSKVLHVGSTGGWNAAKRGECDLAGVHLLDAETGQYNQHLLTDSLVLQPGYRRRQGIVHRADDSRFANKASDEVLRAALGDRTLSMINRNPGSGTRILIDQLLEHASAGQQRDLHPAGYNVQTKSHNAVAAAIEQSRADWGIAIESVAREYGLGFIPIQAECYDFLIPKDRLERPAVRALLGLLNDQEIRSKLKQRGFEIDH